MASTIGATPKVYKNVRSYFERELKNYEVILVRQKITEDVLHLMRGQVFNINDFRGAHS